MRLSASAGPLAGIKVIDHTTALAGPYCTQILGDLGADVIKVERPDGGDMSRGWGPPFVGSESAYFLGTNRNKRGITLNLATETGREVLSRLLLRSDVLVQNIPQKNTRKKLGLDQPACLAKNPKLIWASISGFGNTGPLAERAGYDILGQAMSGTMYITGDEGDPPTRFPTPIADLTAGIYTALAVVSALFARERSGCGQAIDTALLDSQTTWLSNLASNFLAAGESAKKLGNAHPSIVPYQPFPTADEWIIVAIGSERLWKDFVVAVELPELAGEKKFATNPERLAHRDELVTLLSRQFQKRGATEWLARLEAASIPCSQILKPEETLTHDQLIARGMVVELQHPALGAVKMLGNPMKFSRTPVVYKRPAPLLGEHNNEVLHDLGFSSDEIQRFKEEGII